MKSVSTRDRLGPIVRPMLAAVATQLAFTTCHARRSSEAQEPASIVGLLSFTFGDPPRSGVAPQYSVSITDSIGKSILIRVDSGAAIRLEDLRRFQGARVRAVGRYHGNDSTVMWVTTVDSVPARGPR